MIFEQHRFGVINFCHRYEVPELAFVNETSNPSDHINQLKELEYFVKYSGSRFGDG